METHQKQNRAAGGAVSYQVGASAADLERAATLVLDHGPHDFAWFPEEYVQKNIEKVRNGTGGIALAFDGPRLVGVLTFAVEEFFPERVSEQPVGHCSMGVVHPEYRGRSVGEELLRRAAAVLQGQGVLRIYAMRHADNHASGRMMHKAGFVDIETFPDPERRTTGSRCTTIAAYQPAAV